LAEDTDSSPQPEAEESALPPECAAVRDALHRRADGEELTPPEAKALDSHLEACEECASELRRAGEFSSHISELLGHLKPPRGIRDNVLSTIGPLGNRRRTIIGASALAGVALVALLALILSHEGSVARITRALGPVSVLAFSGGEWRPRPGAEDIRASERLAVERGVSVELDLELGRIELVGPSLVQFESTDTGMAVHCIRESGIFASVSDGGTVEIVAGEVHVSVGDGEIVLKVAGNGVCHLKVHSGSARATDASGERTVEEGGYAKLTQPDTDSPR